MAQLATTWFSDEDPILRIGLQRLASLTNRKTELTVVAPQTHLYGQNVFDTPFVRSVALVASLDDVIQTSGFGMQHGTGPNGTDRIVFTPPPNGKSVAVGTTTGILLPLLVLYLQEAESLVIAAMVGKGYLQPALDEVAVSPYNLVLCKSWAWTIAEYFMVTRLKVAPLGDAFAQIERAYSDVVGGEDIKKQPGFLNQIDAPYVLPWPKAATTTVDTDFLVLANRRVFREPRESGWDTDQY